MGKLLCGRMWAAAVLAAVMVLLGGCGREGSDKPPQPEGVSVGESAGSGQDGADTGGAEDNAAPVREQVEWGAHEPVYEDGREVLTLGTMTSWPDKLESLIADYNRQSEEYAVRMVQYYDEEKEYDDCLTALLLDIMRGQAPDILDLGGVDYYPWAEKRVLEDLYPYIDADEELGRDAFVGNVLDAYAVGGKLYAIGPRFNLMTMYGKTSEVGEKTGYRISEMLELAERCRGDQCAIGLGGDMSVLQNLCAFSLNDFVDWDRGTCDFTAEGFREILEFCKSHQENESLQAWNSGEILLNSQVFNSVGDYQLAEAMAGEPITCVGFPCAEGSGTLVQMLGDYAINADASNKQACWDFLKYMLEQDEGYGFPLLRQRFDDEIQQAMVDELSTDPTGTDRVPKACHIGLNNNSTFVYAASQEQVDAFLALVDSADRPYQYHKEIINILMEEAEDYFNGRKSLEDTVAVIQSRASIYVAE